MLIAAALIPLAALVINDTRVELTQNTITVDVALSEPVVMDKVRALTGPQRMYVYVPGATSAHRTYEGPQGKTIAHPRSKYTKLEIPTVPGTRCQEPVLVENTRTGVRLRATCGALDGLGVPARPIEARPLPADTSTLGPRTPEQEKLLRAALAPVEAIPAHTATQAPAVNPAPVAPVAVPAPAVPVAQAVVPAPQAPVAPAPAPTVPAAPATQPQVVAPAVAVAQPQVADAAKPSIPGTTGGASLLFAALVIAGLGAAAYFFSKKRRPSTRMIKIVETASIGPRRSLVVATINGRTLILGVSEAGVALLDTNAMPPAPARLPAAQPEREDEGPSAQETERLVVLRNKLMAALTGGQGSSKISETEQVAAPETSSERSEQGILGRIFARPSAQAARREHEFEDILEDSYEDQELRRKLAQGVGGRVA